MEMLPVPLASEKMTDVCLRDIKYEADCRLCHCPLKAPNQSHIRNSQLCIPVAFALCTCGVQMSVVTPFRDHVTKITTLRSKKEMIWAHTKRCVAPMAHKTTGWNKPES